MHAKHTRALTGSILLAALVGLAACEADPTDPVTPTNPVTIQTTTLAEAIQGVGYSQQLQAAGGNGEYSWLLAAGSLPAGLALSPAGAIFGTPAVAGAFSFQVRVTDANGRTAMADLAIPVVQALAVHTLALPVGMMGEFYAGQLQAVGGRGTLEWNVVGGPAAAWLTVSSTGALSGAPAAPGASSVIVAVADEAGQQATRDFPIVILHPLAVAESSLPMAIEGRVYAVQLGATGGDGMYAWDIEEGALPAGVALSGAGGLAGIPGAGGEFAFVARVTDGRGRSASRPITLTVERAPTIQTGSVPPGQPGEPYAFQLAATGGTGAYTWSMTEGALPGGLSLSAAGAITGTPAALGSSSFTVQVTDEAAATHTRAFTLVVAEVMELEAGTAITGLAGAAGSDRFYAIEMPAGATQLKVTVSGGTGDVDLYVRRGSLPEQYMYDCRPFRPGNDEICTFSPPFLTAGNWYIMLRGYVDYEGVSLVADIED